MPTIKQFIQGFKKYRKTQFIPNEQHFRDLVEHGQSPNVMIITCSDSRIPVQPLLGAESGELFIVRNVANLVPDVSEGEIHLSTTSALEFAVRHLLVSDIIVMGHSECGGIKALMQSGDNNEPCNIAHWVTSYEATRDKVLHQHQHKNFSDQCHECEKMAVLTSLEHLASYPWIKKRLDDGSLHIHGWYYNLSEGMLYEIQPDATLLPLDKDKA